MALPDVELNIWLAIKARIETVSVSPGRALPFAWPGVRFNPPSSQSGPEPFIRVGTVRASPARVMIKGGGRHDRRGFIIITLVWPLGQDSAVYENLAGRISAHFEDGLIMNSGGVCVSVPSYPSVQEGYEDAGYWNVPVRIPWQCFA